MASAKACDTVIISWFVIRSGDVAIDHQPAQMFSHQV